MVHRATVQRAIEGRLLVQVEVIAKRTIYDGFLKLEETTLRYELFDGTMSEEVTRLNVERGDSVAAVVVDADSGSVILTNQFRYPTYTKDGGWLLELPAGSVEEGQEPVEAMKRELIEELGLPVRRIHHITTFYTSPGGLSERVWLYYAEVSQSDRVSRGGGLAAEGEDIQACLLREDEVAPAIGHGRIRDAKSLIGLLWLTSRADIVP
jgi:nudix-type nucleoside diphosphatase (YffH/AdpP family)